MVWLKLTWKYSSIFPCFGGLTLFLTFWSKHNPLTQPRLAYLITLTQPDLT